ncbi:hypothetical protein MASR2M117_11250 [Paludibacter sp.]
MKLFITIILTAFATFLNAQQLAQKYLSQLPSFPDNICNVSDAEENNYRNQIIALIAAIDAEVERLGNQLPTEKQALQTLSKKTGISKQQLNEMENSDDGSESEKQMLKKTLNEYGISMDEIKNLENMSEAEQQEWGENYAKSDKRIQKQKQDKSQFKRSEQVNALEKELAYYTSEWGKMQTDYEKHEKIAKADLDSCLEKVLKNAPQPQYQGENCINQNAIDEYFEKNETLCHNAYCAYLTPKKKMILNKKKADLPKMCELSTRLQSLRNEMLKSQSGVTLNVTGINEISALNLVKEYAKEML